MYFYCYETTIGSITLVEENNKIIALNLNSAISPQGGLQQETPLLQKAHKQLAEYLNGTRSSFELPLAPQGTPFQQQVWQALQAIPYGSTATYKEIAIAVGNPKGCRAVGMANNKNPIGIIIPCHRVIGSNGKLTGYAGGLDTKQILLDLEKKHK